MNLLGLMKGTVCLVQVIAYWKTGKAVYENVVVLSDCNFLYRGSAQLVALICVKPAYPAVAPIFSISLNWDGEKNATSSEWVRSVSVTFFNSLPQKVSFFL
jgi:hypothetical protein